MIIIATDYGTGINPRGETVTLKECPDCGNIGAVDKDSGLIVGHTDGNTAYYTGAHKQATA